MDFTIIRIPGIADEKTLGKFWREYYDEILLTCTESPFEDSCETIFTLKGNIKVIFSREKFKDYTKEKSKATADEERIRSIFIKKGLAEKRIEEEQEIIPAVEYTQPGGDWPPYWNNFAT